MKRVTDGRTWNTWRGMLDRCRNQNHFAYKYYGGKGVTVCKKWETYEGFLEDMGERPKGMTLDRVKSHLGYSKENCRWASWIQQRENRSDLIWVRVEGVKMTLTAACRKLRKVYSTVHSRIYKAGKTPQEAIDA